MSVCQEKQLVVTDSPPPAPRKLEFQSSEKSVLTVERKADPIIQSSYRAQRLCEITNNVADESGFQGDPTSNEFSCLSIEKEMTNRSSPC